MYQLQHGHDEEGEWLITYYDETAAGARMSWVSVPDACKRPLGGRLRRRTSRPRLPRAQASLCMDAAADRPASIATPSFCRPHERSVLAVREKDVR